MRKHLAKINWNNTLENKTATECWNILKSEIDCTVEQFVPLKKRGNGQKRNTYQKKPLEKSNTSKLCGRHIDIMEVKKTMPFIKKHLTKLQLKLEIQREAMNKN